ncbi:MAG: hypothetical protein U9N43_01060, partial [Euryarchaeota archaeon]|nr:hypothetical protein [Euryarchaeota archaeon]
LKIVIIIKIFEAHRVHRSHHATKFHENTDAMHIIQTPTFRHFLQFADIDVRHAIRCAVPLSM